MNPLLNVIIVDDEEFARSSLYFLLQENCEDVHIIGIAKSTSEAKIMLAAHKVDLIFLDIAMPGENGFGLIPAIQENNAQVIFTTAYDQYALKAIKANALDYLLKPIDIEEMKEAVLKAKKFIDRNKGVEIDTNQLNNLAQNLKDRSEVKKLTLPNGQGYTVINIDEIISIEADSNYSIFHLADKETITVSKILKEYEEILPDNQFIRIHKSSIINLNHLREYNSKNGLEVILSDGQKIAVSRRRTSDFLEKVKSFTILRTQ